jgi:hypothetical protein
MKAFRKIKVDFEGIEVLTDFWDLNFNEILNFES